MRLLRKIAVNGFHELGADDGIETAGDVPHPLHKITQIIAISSEWIFIKFILMFNSFFN